MLPRFLLAAFAAACCLAPVSAASPAPSADKLVKIEVRIISVVDDYFERIGVNFTRDGKMEVLDKRVEVDKPLGRESSSSHKPRFLDDEQLGKLMESLTGDIRANVRQAPSLMLSDGKKGEVRCVQKYPSESKGNDDVWTGYVLSVQPFVTGKRVLLDLRMTLNNLDSEKPLRISTLSLDDTLSIPAGHTVVLGGWKRVIEARNEYGPPVVSSIPYVGRLFRSVGYSRSSEKILVLVTTSVVAEDGKETSATKLSKGRKRNP